MRRAAGISCCRSCSCSCSCSCHAASASRARRALAVLLLLLELVVLVVPAVVPCCPRCQRCAAEVLVALVVLLLLVYFLLVLLLEEQRRENPHATAGTFASKIVPSPVRRAYLPKLSSQKIHHLVTNSTEQQSAHRQMARISRQAFFPSAAGLRGRLSRHRKAGKDTAPFITRRQLGAPWGPVWAVPPLK